MCSEHMIYTVWLSVGDQQQIEQNEHALVKWKYNCLPLKTTANCLLVPEMLLFIYIFLCVISCNCASTVCTFWDYWLSNREAFQVGFSNHQEACLTFNLSYFAKSSVTSIPLPSCCHRLWFPRMYRKKWKQNDLHQINLWGLFHGKQFFS